MSRDETGEALVMDADGSEADRYSCCAAFITVDADVAVPALILQPARGDHDVIAPASRMALAGLPSLTAVSGALDRAPGWLVLTGRGSDRVDVLTRTADVRQVFGGTSALAEDWLDEVERTGCCALLVGALGLCTAPGAAPGQAEVARAVAAAAAAGCVSGGLVPVYLPTLRDSHRVWPGVVQHRPEQEGRHRASGPLRRPSGVSFGVDVTEELVAVVARVRAEARGKSYAWVRQRLMVELLPYEVTETVPGVLDYLAEDVAYRGLPGAMRRWARARRRSMLTAGLILKTVVALIGRKPLPHWHIFGMHMVDTSGWGAPTEVALDPWADELVAMDSDDEIIVWLGMQQGSSGPAAHRTSVVAYYGDHRLGVLAGDDGFYRSILGEPGHADVRVVTEAVRSRADDGSWRLHVRAPVPEWGNKSYAKGGLAQFSPQGSARHRSVGIP